MKLPKPLTQLLPGDGECGASGWLLQGSEGGSGRSGLYDVKFSFTLPVYPRPKQALDRISNNIVP